METAIFTHLIVDR